MHKLVGQERSKVKAFQRVGRAQYFCFWHKDCFVNTVITIRKGVKCAIRVGSRGYKGYHLKGITINT